MATLIVPELDLEPWPTLGPDICDWIEENLTYGPGDLRGQPYKVEDEFRAIIYRAYEVVPQDRKGAGRRRFNRVGLNIRKGTAKTEKAAIIAAAELHSGAPVRCDGFDAYGRPVGRGVVEPYVAMVAFTLEQTEELGFNVLRTILEESPLYEDFDIGLERIMVLDQYGRAAGKAVPLTGAPNARDGARTTHNSFDETHRMTTPRLVSAHTTMLQNAYKRQMADAWSLETTTMFDPTEQSVAMDTHTYAAEVAEGRMKDSRLFYFHRYAPIEMPLSNVEEVTAALVEASGPAVAWSGDIEGLAAHWFEPKTDQNYFRRVWLNQKVSGGGKAFDSVMWELMIRPAYFPVRRSKIALGFDGARTRDGTAIVAGELTSNYMWLAGYWQRGVGHELDDDEWECDPSKVQQVLEFLFDEFEVVRMYGDPYHWTSEMDTWRGRWGERKVLSFSTTSLKRTGLACASFATDIKAGAFSHDGNAILAQHIGNAVRLDTQLRGDDEVPLWVIEKERRGSPLKIDAAMAAILCRQAMNDSIATGAVEAEGKTYSFN